VVKSFIACGGRKCCPKVKIFSYDKVTIVDDDTKEKISMKKSQAIEAARIILAKLV